MSEYLKELENIKTNLSNLDSSKRFETLALNIFKFQYDYNQIYRKYCELINLNISNVRSVSQIPHLPIHLFKNNIIKTGTWIEEKIFRSSGTGSQVRSKHYVKSEKEYLSNTVRIFSEFFNHPSEYCFIAVLPGYKDKSQSSLVSMVNYFIELSSYEDSGFYLNKKEKMIQVLDKNKIENIPTILFGVSFGLLELSKLDIDFPELIIIETGGMKSSKISLDKKDIIQDLKENWNLDAIYSEYGMTELFSQSYSNDSVWYTPGSTMKIQIGQLNDPFSIESPFRAGNLKIIDLANYSSCSFIATEDLGIINENNEFKVLGRLHNSELRGCNLLLEDTL